MLASMLAVEVLRPSKIRSTPLAPQMSGHWKDAARRQGVPTPAALEKTILRGDTWARREAAAALVSSVSLLGAATLCVLSASVEVMGRGGGVDMRAETGRNDSQQEAGGPGSAEDARDLAERLRSQPAEEIVAELVSMMLSTAQVKLGRRDARLFIDLCALTLDHAGPYLSEELRKQVDSALGQLRLGQVSAENERAQDRKAEANDLSKTPTAPKRAGQPEPRSADQQAQATSKLWVPGR